ncbi:MAG: hypothetical protein ACI9R3_006464, partial [Verrucomicrobiales bacterium]
ELGRIGFFGFPPAVVGRRADGFHGLDVERRLWWWWDGEEAESEIVELEKEFDFLRAQDFVHNLHGGFTLGTEERVLAPDAHDEVTPEGTEFELVGTLISKGGSWVGGAWG